MLGVFGSFCARSAKKNGEKFLNAKNQEATYKKQLPFSFAKRNHSPHPWNESF